MSEKLFGSRERRIEASNRYVTVSGYEDTNQDIVMNARQIHAISYVLSGYVSPEAVDSDGCLNTSIDKSRGPNVEYLVTTDPDQPEVQASVRAIHIPEGGGIEDLPFYHHSKEFLYDETIQEINEQIETRGTNSVIELSALSKTNVNPMSSEASLVLVRELFQRAIKGNTMEKWLIVFAEPAYKSFLTMFSDKIVRRAGDDVPIGDEDSKIDQNLCLVPVLIDPCSMMENFGVALREMQGSEGRRGAQSRAYSFIMNFMTSGLSSEEIGVN